MATKYYGDYLDLSQEERDRLTPAEEDSYYNIIKSNLERKSLSSNLIYHFLKDHSSPRKPVSFDEIRRGLICEPYAIKVSTNTVRNVIEELVILDYHIISGPFGIYYVKDRKDVALAA